MSLATKYFGLKESGHDGELVWPGTPDGLPMRVTGSARPLLRNEELEDAPIVCDAKAKVFNLSIPEDLLEYQGILDRYANGWYDIISKAEMYDQTIQNWRVKLEWIQKYGSIPSTKLDQMP